MTEDLPTVKSVKAIIEGDDNFYAMMKAKPLLDRLEWAAFKMCQRGHYEDFASDVMTEAKARIEALEAALRNLLVRFDEYCEEALGHPVTEDAWEEVAVARAALGGKKDG